LKREKKPAFSFSLALKNMPYRILNSQLKIIISGKSKNWS